MNPTFVTRQGHGGQLECLCLLVVAVCAVQLSAMSIAHTQAPTTAAEALSKGSERLRFGDPAAAERLFKLSIDLDGRYWPAYAVLGQYYAEEMVDCARALPFLDAYIDHVKTPIYTHHEILNGALNCHVKLEHWPRALDIAALLQQHYRKRADHRSVRAMMRRTAQIAVKARKFAEALEIVERVLFDDYTDDQAHVLRARLKFYLGRSEEALADYLYIQRTFEGIRYLQLEIGTVLNTLKRYREAITALRYSLDNDGETANVHLQLAVAHGGLKHDFQAERAYRRSLELLGDNPSALLNTGRNNLAWLLVLKSRPGDPRLLEALELARQAVLATEGQEAAYCDTLAEVWLRLGHPDKALKWGRQAQRLDPGNLFFTDQVRRYERYASGFESSGGRVRLRRWTE